MAIFQAKSKLSYFPRYGLDPDPHALSLTWVWANGWFWFWLLSLVIFVLFTLVHFVQNVGEISRGYRFPYFAWLLLISYAWWMVGPGNEAFLWLMD